MASRTGVPLSWPRYVAPEPMKPMLGVPIREEKPQNPALRMLGLPRMRLPSRNWLIFFTVTGSFLSAVYYDRYQKKRIQQKWCDLVQPISEETLAPNTMRRKITIYLQAPPGDGLRAAREHFYEYVKPILVAGAMDWEVVEGRREGDIRYGTAERIRRRRRTSEGGVMEDDEESQKRLVVKQSRSAAGILEEAGAGGDLLIGRHTWKEYVRGLHEGWLGPLAKPSEAHPLAIETTSSAGDEQLKATSDGHAHSTIGDAAVDVAKNIVQGQPVVSASADSAASPSSTTSEFISDKDASPQTPPTDAKKEEEEEKTKTKNQKPEPYIGASAYATTNTPSSIPSSFDPASVIPFPHILGFLNTPVRTYRFLTRRHLADDVGRRVAGLVLAAQSRSFKSSVTDENGYETSEQATLLESEEKEWPKSVRQRKREDGDESVWLDKVIMDERVGERMRIWELRGVDEREADRLRQEPRVERKDE